MNGSDGRRRSPRLEVGAGALVTINSVTSARLVDISLTGVQLEATEVEPSETVELRVPLGGVPFAATVQVRRRQLTRDARGDARVRISGPFVNLDERQSRQLSHFLVGGATMTRNNGD
jgi:hypothetical protein